MQLALKSLVGGSDVGKRIILVAMLLVAMVVPLLPIQPAEATFTWGGGSWLYRKVLSFNALSISENLTSFPVMVKLTSSNFDFTKAQSAGQDLRFVDADDVTELPYEIETSSYNATAQTAIIWVKVPQVSASSNYTDYIYMYYGNAGASDNQQATSVWSSNHTVVLHMADATTSTVADSTSNAKTGTKNLASNPEQIAGTIGKGQSFFGTTSWIDQTATTNVTRFEDTVPYSLSYWVTTNATNPSSNSIVTGGAEKELYRLNSSNTLFTSNTFTIYTINTGTITAGVWAKYDMTVDSSRNLRAYRNGLYTEVATLDTSAMGSSGLEWGNAYIGATDWPLSGALDEIRINKTQLSANWILASYMSEADTLLYFGDTNPAPTVTTQAPSAVSMTAAGVTTATFNGDLTSLGGAPTASIWFDYGIGSFTTSTTNISANATGAFSSVLTTLTPGQTYQVRAAAGNGIGVSYGATENATFTMPTITTGAITNLTLSGGGIATGNFNGEITSLGIASTTYKYIEYGLTAGYGSNTTLVSANATGTFTVTIPTSLIPGATYHYRAVAKCGSVVSNGADASFVVSEASKTANYPALPIILSISPTILFISLLFTGGYLIKTGASNTKNRMGGLVSMVMGAITIIVTLTFFGAVITAMNNLLIGLW